MYETYRVVKTTESRKLDSLLQRADSKRRDRRTKPRPAARKMRREQGR